MSDSESKEGWRRVPWWAWLVAIAVTISTFYTQVWNP